MKIRRLAAVAALFGATAAAPTAFASEPADATVRAFIEAYDRAFNAKDLSTLAALYHPDVTIFEGGHVNTGWIDYRDNHLGPELKEMEDLRFSHVEVVPHVLSDATAYVTAEYRLKAKMDGKPVDAEGLETLILVKGRRWGVAHPALAYVQSPQAAGQPSAKP